MKLFFDLDGTLLDARYRLYQLFNDITEQKLLSFDNYWELKRNMYDHNFILSAFFQYNQKDIDEFQVRWLSKIEDKSYLDLDVLFSYTLPELTRLRKLGIDLYLLTARQNKENLFYELNNNNLTEIFSQILVTEGKKTKVDLLKSLAVSFAEDFIIGDTGLDIQTGKEIGIKTIGVLSGFRSEPFLKKYRPDYLLSNISELSYVLEK